MADSIDDEDADRWDESIPVDLGEKGVQQWFEDREPTNPDGSTWTQSQIDGFAKRVSERRGERFPVDSARQTMKDKTDLGGMGARKTGKRVAMVRDAEGKYLGRAKDINTYVDNNGHLMAYRKGEGNEPGGRRILAREYQ